MCPKSIIQDCAKNFVTNLLFSTAISGITNQPDIWPIKYPAIEKITFPPKAGYRQTYKRTLVVIE